MCGNIESNTHTHIMGRKATYQRSHFQQWIKAGKPRSQSNKRWKKFYYVVVKNVNGSPQPQIGGKRVVFREEVDSVLKQMYFEPSTGFMGVRRFNSQVQQRYVGILKKDVSSFLFRNEVHRQHRHQNPNRTTNPLKPNRPGSHWQADLQDLTKTAGANNGKGWLLAVIDVFSKYVYARPLANKTAPVVAAAMKEILDEEARKNNRMPSLVQTDQGSEFIADEFKKVLSDVEIRHVMSTSHNPRAQGAVERWNKTIKGFIERYLTANNTNRWVDIIQDIITAYNTSIHSTTKKIPRDVHSQHANPEEVKQARDSLHRKANIKLATNAQNRLEVGSYVRVSLLTMAEVRKKQFRKGFKRQWTSEIFKVVKELPRGKDPIRQQYYYKIKLVDGREDTGEILEGIYHRQRLLPTASPEDTIRYSPSKKPKSQKEKRAGKIGAVEPVITRARARKLADAGGKPVAEQAKPAAPSPPREEKKERARQEKVPEKEINLEDADVYEVSHIVSQRKYKGRILYKVRWAGKWNSPEHDTYEPAKNINKAALDEWREIKKKRKKSK